MSAGHRLKVSPARGGYITRVEVLDGKFLYAINVHTTGAAQYADGLMRLSTTEWVASSLS